MRLNIQCPFFNGNVSVDHPRVNAEYICPHCGVRVSKVDSLAKPETEFTTIAELLSDELKEDVSYIMTLGIKLEKGKLVTKTGGLGLAGYEAFSGHWITALLAGGLSLAASSIADGYARIKLQEMRKKWFEILSSFNEGQLSCLMSTVQRKYPLLLPQVRGLLGP